MSKIDQIKNERGGFIAAGEIAEIVKEDRLLGLLVRTDRGRFICASQDAEHFIAMVDNSEGDRVRDVSIRR